MTTLVTLDWIILAAYFVLIGVLAIWAIRRERNTSADYFLAGRNIGWVVVGTSLFASNIGSEHLVGLAGTGAASGVALGQFELQASLVLLLLGWVFVPFYIKSGVFTMPEFLERRYGPASRWYLSIISIVGYVLTKISVTIYAGAVVFEALMGISFWTGALIVVVVTGVYTIFGGLRAVVYTELVQTFVLIGGAVAVTWIGLSRVGGWGEMAATVPDGFLNMWKPMTHPDFPWTGIAFGAPIIAIWYWCTDQFIVQRTLAAANVTQARRGTIFAGFLKQLPLFLFVIPGVIATALATKGLLPAFDADQALPVMVRELLPVGLRGLVVAGLLAALMSSLASVFNSASTLVTLDVYKKINPAASERRLVWVGQLATVLMTVLGILWIPMMANISGVLYQYLQSVQGYISPPIAAVFLLGIFWRRLNGSGAIAALITGFVLGMGRLVAELFKGDLTEGTVLFWFADVNFMHMAIFLFLICVVVLVAVSYMTAPPPPEKTRGITFGAVDHEGPLPDTTPKEGMPEFELPRFEELPKARGVDKLLSLLLILIVAAVMIMFTP